MEITHANLIKLMIYRPTLKETANWFNVSEDTISRRIKEFENISFSDFKEKHSYKTRQRLINKAFEMALSGNSAMMIFCLKSYCGWNEKPQNEENEVRTIHLAYRLEDLKPKEKA